MKVVFGPSKKNCEKVLTECKKQQLLFCTVHQYKITKRGAMTQVMYADMSTNVVVVVLKDRRLPTMVFIE